MAQTVYNTEQGAAYAGMKGDLSPDYVRSYFNQNGSALPFGVMVKQGTADNQATEYSSAATPLGVSLHTHSYQDGQGNIPTNGPMNVMRRGTVWALVDGTVVANGPVFIRHSTGAGGSVKGTFRGDADTATADSFPAARFLTAGTTGQLVLVELNLP